jgi:hypothetical protein
LRNERYLSDSDEARTPRQEHESEMQHTQQE